MAERPWRIVEGEGPLVAVAIHNGHAVREELKDLYALSDHQRLREEDPFTGDWTMGIADTQVIVFRSRFEVDLNRPHSKAVYLHPEDAWGLKVWKETPGEAILEASLRLYDDFYSDLQKILQDKVDRYGRFVVFDLHSYNHRRIGPLAPLAPPLENPEVNIGTGAMDRSRWAGVVDAFIDALSRFDLLGRTLDVRENVKFRGGYLSRWIREQFPESGCALAVEFKKFFMDEWTAQPFPDQIEAIGRALQSTKGPVLEALHQLGKSG